MIRIVTPPVAVPEALVLSEVMQILAAPTSKENRVRDLIRDATRLAEQIAARYLFFREYEQGAAGGDDRLYLNARPISAVTSVAYGDGAPIASSTYQVWPEDGFLLYRGGAAWTGGRTFWTVRYEGGYWLPSMAGDRPVTAAEISASGRHVRKAIEEIVVASYQMDSVDRTVRAERIGGRASVGVEYETGLWVPEGAEKTLRRLAPLVA